MLFAFADCPSHFGLRNIGINHWFKNQYMSPENRLNQHLFVLPSAAGSVHFSFPCFQVLFLAVLVVARIFTSFFHCLTD